MFRAFKLTLVTLALIVISIAVTQSAYAVPGVVNGNFDIFVPSGGTGGGWTSSTIFAGGHRTTGGNPGGTFILNHFGEVATDPTISQVVSGFTIGQTYTLTGDVALSVGLSGGVPGFGVDVGGVNVLQLNAPAIFISFSHTFTADATDIEIRFRGEINGTDNPYRIDNIAITQVGGTPEPIRVVLSRDASGQLQATVTITNPLSDPVPGVQMTLVRASTLDGSAFIDGVPVPQSFGTVNPGQSVVGMVTFPGTAGVPAGFEGLVRVDLSFTGGTYSETKNVIAP